MKFVRRDKDGGCYSCGYLGACDVYDLEKSRFIPNRSPLTGTLGSRCTGLAVLCDECFAAESYLDGIARWADPAPSAPELDITAVQDLAGLSKYLRDVAAVCDGFSTRAVEASSFRRVAEMVGNTPDISKRTLGLRVTLRRGKDVPPRADFVIKPPPPVWGSRAVLATPCECGAAATGIVPGQAGHSSWCGAAGSEA